MSDSRNFRRFSHSLPVTLHIPDGAGGTRDASVQLKDISPAALCLLVPGKEDPRLPHGARARIVIEGKTDVGTMEFGGTVLYSLLIGGERRQCVLMFDGIYDDVVTSLKSHERLSIWL